MLCLADVSLRIDGRDILDGISFQTSARRVGVVGRNGSGKTTLARIIAGLVVPTKGTVRLSGIDVAKDRRAALREVGILFQNPDHQIIFPTVIEEVSFGLSQLGCSKAETQMRAEEILARFGRSPWRDAAIHVLSQGQRQLVCLMSVLAMKPRLIILDEPFAGLDIPTAMHLSRVLDGIEAQLLHITHDPEVLRDYDHVIWIDAGRVAQDGPATTLLPAYQTHMAQIGDADDLAQLTG